MIASSLKDYRYKETRLVGAAVPQRKLKGKEMTSLDCSEEWKNYTQWREKK